MKKLLYILLFVPLTLFGQVYDFTVTDIHGNTHNLHSYLNEDKYVIVSFIDIWSITHQEIANDIIEGYISFGSNTMDVIFISMTLDSNEDDCAQFLNNYMQGDESYPIVSSQESIENTYFGDAQLPSVHFFYPPLSGHISENIENVIYDIQNEFDIMPIYSFGCTDIQAFNYNEAADIEDGSCIPVIIGCLNEDYFEFDVNANTDDESYCINEVVLGCMDETAFNYDALANLEPYLECIDVILGCTNPTAYNYNPDANTDDGSCEAVLEGCSDETAFNYNASANTDDGSCIYYGCTNYNYLEYNEGANVDDGSCLTFKIWGCTDSTAYNYNVDANTADSPCYYDDYAQEMQYAFLTESVIDETYYLYFLIESLSNQVQNLQESLSSVIEAEEVVSDANSFDVLNPLSYNGEFEVVNINSGEQFVVPNGNTLVVNNVVLSSKVDNTPLIIPNIEDYTPSYSSNLNVPILISQGSIVEGELNGILIEMNTSSIHTNLIGNTSFIVPTNQTFVITGLGEDFFGACNFRIDGIPIIEANPIKSLVYVRDSINIAPTSTSDLPYICLCHGFLIDNSNYTYATDYELIDALNEGMDSLSTLSEEVALVNDSISSENAILTEENEALMAIDYNYDSLQYVTEYLYSQVFDLQQEILVPNIDVDMAIGWNMIGFSCPEEKDADEALIDIVDELIILKDNNGDAYVPEWNFNGIGNLTPGHGYQLKISTYILDFNICE